MGQSRCCYTASLFLPFALLAAITFLPFFVFILVLKPCVLFLGVLWGWNVLFIYFVLHSVFPASTAGCYLDAILSKYVLNHTNEVF